DPGAIVAGRFDARRTPEAFVLDRDRRVRYRGRIDDQYGVGIHKPTATRHELRDAIDAVLAGRQPSTTVTEAPGCPIDRPCGDRPPGLSGQTGRSVPTITYCRDIAPILQKHCQVCHRPGQVGPFALLSHADAAGWADAIREVVEQGRMPPWGASPKHGKF